VTPLDLTNKAALITGGKRIGAAIATALAERGMDVALSFNRSQTEAEAAAAEVRARGRRAFLYAADLSRGDQARALIDRAAADLGRLDAIVNMASVYSSVPLEQSGTP
jgi:NAD(P)-dependent dehydrogenase (short-subunit alcohol dehydrogenase family)